MPEAQRSRRAHVVVEGLNIHTQRTSSNIVHEALHTALDDSMHADVWRREAMLWPAVCCYMQRTSSYIVHEAVHTVDEGTHAICCCSMPMLWCAECCCYMCVHVALQLPWAVVLHVALQLP